MNNSPYCTVGQSSSSNEMKFPGANSVTLLQLPDEILIEIFLNLGGESRIALGATCKRFYNLVFSDKKLLRRLDFSEEGYLRGISDIGKYFRDKKKYLHIHELIIRNNYCINPRVLLVRVIRAQNLVEIDVVGTQLKTIGDIERLLSLLPHVTRLSITWLEDEDIPKEEINILLKGFGRLRYLFLHVVENRESMLHALDLCQELVELVILTTKIQLCSGNTIDLHTSLRKLKKFVCVNVFPERDYECYIQREILRMLPDPNEWVYLYYDQNSCSCYMEKRTQIPKEYTNSILDAEIECLRIRIFGSSVLRSTVLLKEAIELTKGKIVNEHLQKLLSVCGADFIISIEDTKKLLQNPRHEITFLNIQPKEELNLINVCSALTDFPGLKKLVLPSIDTLANDLSSKVIPKRSEDQSPLPLKRKRVSHVAVADTSTAESPFRKLTKSTPYLESFTIIAGPQSSQEKKQNGIEWDLPALVYISKWKNLTALCLVGVPILNGKFLIEIGKTCEELKELTLMDLGPEGSCVYKQHLVEMLTNCRNLRKFLLSQKNVGKIAPLLVALRNSSKLKQVGIKSLGIGTVVDNLEKNVIELIQSTKIVLFVCNFDSMTQTNIQRLKTSLKGLRKDLPRPALRFEIMYPEKWRDVDLYGFWKKQEMPYFLLFRDTTIAQQLHVL